MSFFIKIKKYLLGTLFVTTICSAHDITQVEVEKLPRFFQRVEISLPELNFINCPQQGGVFTLSTPINLNRRSFRYFKYSNPITPGHQKIITLPTLKITSSFYHQGNNSSDDDYRQTKFDLLQDLIAVIPLSERDNRSFRLKIKYVRNNLKNLNEENGKILEGIKEKVSLKAIKR